MTRASAVRVQPYGALDRVGLAVAGNEQDRLFGPFGSYLPGDIGAREAGHDEVDDDEVGPFALDCCETLAAVTRLSDAIAMFLQRRGDECTNVRIVVDHQDRCRLSLRADLSRLGCHAPGHRRRFLRLAEQKLHRSAFASLLSIRAAPPDWRAMP